MITFLMVAASVSWFMSISCSVIVYADTPATKEDARWLLVSIFFGWAMLPILALRGVCSLWRKAELPMPHLPKRVTRGEHDVSEGALSVIEEKDPIIK